MTADLITNAFSVPAPCRTNAPSFAVAAATLALTVFAFALRAPALVAVALGAGICLMALHQRAWSRAERTERAVALFMLALLLFSLPTAVPRDPVALAHGAVSVVALGTAFVLTRDLDTYLRASAWVLWSVQAAVVVFLAINGVDDFPLERILPDSSSNGITSYLVALQANYCIVRFLLRGRASMATPLLTLAICVVGYGRGSILAATAIVLINAVAACLDSRRPTRSAVTVLITACLAAWVYGQHGEDIAGYVEVNTKIGSGLVDEHREQQISEYLDRLDLLALLIGGEYEGTSIARDYNNNPHNAFIRAHHVFGLAYVVAVSALPFLAMSRRLDRSRRLYAQALVIVILFRAFTEPILFPTLLDTVYFALCFALGRARIAPR